MRKVLIVEDDANVARLVGELLAEEGLISVHKTDLESGWAALIAEDPDAVILDLWLYGRDSGWDLLERIRGNEHFRDLAVVVLTGVTGQDAVDRATALNAEFLNKPFTPAALMDRLRRALRSAGRAPDIKSYEVVLLTPVFRIEGIVHVQSELSRFSDAWEALVRDPRAYVPLTKASIRSLDGGHVHVEHDLIEIRKSDVTAIFPREPE